jgi:hypothetical protein
LNAPREDLNTHRASLSVFKIKMIILMGLELKNFKDQYKIKEGFFKNSI